MIYLNNLTKITDEKYNIGFIHYKPFDKIHGLNKSKEQLEKEGVLVESIPELKYTDGKQPIMYYNPIKKELFYEYEDIPKNTEENQNETFAKTLAQLTIDNKQKDTVIKNLSQTIAQLTIEVNKIKKEGE